MIYVVLFVGSADFPLCILSLILTQTCRANCRTPLRHNHTREEISPLHCSLLETSFLPGHAPPPTFLVLSAPAWPGPVGPSRGTVFLELTLHFPDLGSPGPCISSFLFSPFILPFWWLASFWNFQRKNTQEINFYVSHKWDFFGGKGRVIFCVFFN